MKMSNVFAFLLSGALLAVSATVAVAGGAGGVGFSGQLYDTRLSNTDLGVTQIGGFGYGVSEDGNRIGGFGTSFLSESGDTAGGVGGMVFGHEWRGGPLVFALTLWGGLGGGALSGGGYMLAYGAAQAELGVWVLPWMQLTAYVGYEVLGNVVPGVPFGRALLRTPVLGMRLAWGSP